MKKNYIRRIQLYMLALLTVAGIVSSCNSSTTTGEEIAVTVSTVAVKEFKLSANSDVMTGLDTVFFSIDLNRGVIFNADSLPKGSDITKLVPVITFANSVSKAEIVMSGGTEKNDTVNYLTNSTDSVDFSRTVKLDVTAYDGVNSYSYLLKVNVHEQVPDSLMWNRMEHSPFPSRLGAAIEQKSVYADGVVSSLIKEKDGSYTLASTSGIASGQWSKKAVTLPFVPDVRSLECAGGKYFILDENGALYESADLEAWDATGETWVTLIGGYLDSVLGIKLSDGKMMHCHYPASEKISNPEMDPEFPIRGRSALRVIETKYTDEPTAIFVGGESSTGDITGATWGFDGTTWAKISDTEVAAIEGTSLVHYVIYRKTSSNFKFIDIDAWLLIGGRFADGSNNRLTYVSYDNGVTWAQSYDTLTPPEDFPSLTSADAIVISSTLDADLADGWTVTRAAATRSVDYTLDGTEIYWECPYIYILGGIEEDGTLSADIWRGVLSRLTFTPII